MSAMKVLVDLEVCDLSLQAKRNKGMRAVRVEAS